MFKTGFILLIISSMLIPVIVFAGGIELHSDPGACPGDPSGGGETSPSKALEQLIPAVKIVYISLPVPSSSGNICYLILIPVAVKQDEYSKNSNLQLSYSNHR